MTETDRLLALLRRCGELERGPTSLQHLVTILQDVGGLFESDIAVLCRADHGRPYGRRLLFEGRRVEAMLATWTPMTPCVPHDHGGSVGAVRILRGRARHVIWRVDAGRLIRVREEVAGPGEILLCSPDVIHSLGDDGAETSLVTLHLYTDAIDHMVLYDLERSRTLIVDGACGAWIPHDEPARIRAVVEGIVPLAAMGAASEGAAFRWYDTEANRGHSV